jgi:hypothetical protein
MNVRHGNITKVHAITPADHSELLNRTATPACGAYLGNPKPRQVTPDAVTCRKCEALAGSSVYAL